MGSSRIKEIPLVTQEKALLRAFPGTFTNRKRHSLVWVGSLRPTPLSRSYSLYLKLEGGKTRVSVISPKKLSLHPDKKLLPHVYSTPKQRLCLFYPDGKQWNKGKLLLDTIIPWASEWLRFYELWLITGEWLGGGTEHVNEERNAA